MSERTSQRAPVAAPAQTRGPLLQRACACGQHTGGGECAACKQKRETGLQRAAVSNEPQVAPPIVHEVLRGSSQPLDAQTRAAMEPRFGQDFSRVRVHTDARAAESARAVNALAYTVGRDVVFGAGQYAPGTHAGRRLMAHELAHILQSPVSPPLGQVRILDSNDPIEQEANKIAQPFFDHRAIHAGNRGGMWLGRQKAGENASQDQAGQAVVQANTTADQTQGSTVGSASAVNTAVTIPICKSTPVNNWISDPQKPNAQLFGLTTLSGKGGTLPEFKVEPGPGGKGVKVKPTKAALQPIDMQFLAVGQYPDSTAYQWQCDLDVDTSCTSGTFLKPQIIWDVTTDSSKRLREAEEEHCLDYQYAFYLILGRAAEIVNELASSNKIFPNEAAAKAELQKTVKLDPKDWFKYFVCLAEKSVEIRDRNNRHTPLSPTQRQVRKRIKMQTISGRKMIANVPIILPSIKVHPPMEVLQDAMQDCNTKIHWKP